MHAAHRSQRFAALAARDVNRETFIREWPDVGLVAMDSPLDPTPSLTVEAGQIVEMDGKRRADVDLIDCFIAERALDRAQAERAMATGSLDIARMLVDPVVPRAALIAVLGGCTPVRSSASDLMTRSA